MPFEKEPNNNTNSHTSFEKNTSGIEAHRKLVQKSIHESLARLRDISEDETLSPEIKQTLSEEIIKLGKVKDNITHLYEKYIQAKKEARKDSLTEIPNLRAFEETLDIKIERARKIDSAALYVLHIDIDRFKRINDEYGHSVGNEYLRLISSHVATVFRPDDMFARIGGDEFAATFFLRKPNSSSDNSFDYDGEAKIISDRVYQAIYLAKCELRDKLIARGIAVPEIDPLGDIASIGYVRFNGDQDINTLMEQADSAMYTIKKSGRHDDVK